MVFRPVILRLVIEHCYRTTSQYIKSQRFKIIQKCSKTRVYFGYPSLFLIIYGRSGISALSVIAVRIYGLQIGCLHCLYFRPEDSRS